MSSNPTTSITSNHVTAVVGTVTAVISAIEQIAAASGLGGVLNVGQIEQLTTLFGNLAGVALQAAHDILGKPVTADSVLALMPGSTALVNPGS